MGTKEYYSTVVSVPPPGTVTQLLNRSMNRSVFAMLVQQEIQYYVEDLGP